MPVWMPNACCLDEQFMTTILARKRCFLYKYDTLMHRIGIVATGVNAHFNIKNPQVEFMSPKIKYFCIFFGIVNNSIRL